ncbi:hypothetical protein FNI14_00580 [Salmonella enterica subsp. salamae]|uniref:Uncharacterized protein n=1 Tax=Salmonella enterica subsp. salamae TaxID=59202 RepID=A0A5Y1W952_SALER|nr:hypothetical protein [Salmonella enterica subsp. salamae]ECQ6336945.1 hypothetical protein [Salmonella enterica subsp. enterica serovar Abony]EFS2582330.1 hypothetical protein [Salmonella enterica]EGK6862439.1 hypothetical protein [Salmonella enterica subsp. enterica serovar Glostrup]ECD9354078.1 hypothetical protein [Salmonella enterica subsp. salamae]
MHECESFKVMSYDEREALKDFARRSAGNGDITSLELTIVMISHWMRQRLPVCFTEYARQWVESNRGCGNDSTSSMRQEWPFSGDRHIYNGCTRYYPEKIEHPEDRP